MQERHRILRDFFLPIGVDHRTAKADAERIEHHISDASLEKLVPFARKTTTPAQTAKLKDG